ncbi:MAG: tetratricopeptide repeat protein [Bacteroidetes bacterium]|nr:tetratricopeptide repeat protein [Bacteroidota bacterium]
MRKLIIYLFCFVVFVSFGQKKHVFNESVTDYYSKVDSLPFFLYEKAELDTFIALNRVIPVTAEIYGVKCEAHVGFKVDAKNNINSLKNYYTDIVFPKNVVMNDYKYYDSLKLFFEKETQRLIMATDGLWFSDSLKCKGEIKYKIFYISDGYNKLNKNADNAYFNTKGNTAPKNIELGSPASLLVKKDLYNYGVRKFSIKRTLLAKAYFVEAIKYYPKDIDAHYNLATCYLKLKDQQKACYHWNKCLELGDKEVQTEINKYCN